MMLSIPISPETEAKLRAEAARAGIDLQTLAARTLEKLATRPSLEEILAPLRAEVAATGTDEAELTEQLELAKHQLRSGRATP